MAQAAAVVATAQEGGLSASRVRVTGLRRDAYVEFDFSLGDDALSIELIPPFSAFAEFRTARQAQVLPNTPPVAEVIEHLSRVPQDLSA
jgi:hypothetical protein